MAEVRRLTPMDAATILPLIYDHAGFENGTATCTKNRIANALAGDTPRLIGWLATYHGKPAGYATATCDFSTWSGADFLYLDCLFVIPERRGLGIGRQLLDAVIEYGRRQDLARLEWQTPAWNQPAGRFYRRAGAVETAKLRFSLGL